MPRTSRVLVSLATALAALVASTTAQAYTLVPGYSPPVIAPPSGFDCYSEYQPNSSADPKWFTPIVPVVTPYQEIGQFSLSRVPDFTTWQNYSAQELTVAAALSIVTNNLGPNTSIRGLQNYYHSTDVPNLLADARRRTQQNSGIGSGTDPFANGLCNSRAFENECKGTSPYPLGNDSTCYVSGFMPNLDPNDIAQKTYDGTVGILYTNVETWDGRAWTYGVDHFYIIYGVNSTWFGPSFLLYDATNPTATFGANLTPTRLNIRWSNGGVSANRAVTVINSTSSTQEVVIGYYGLDGIVNDFQ